MIGHPYIVALIAVAWPFAIGLASVAEEEIPTAIAMLVMSILTLAVAWPA